MKKSAIIALERLRTEISIGCYAEEMKKRQIIEISLKILFPTPPIACESDRLEDTICYAKISDLILQKCSQQHWHTIEYLGHNLYQMLIEFLPDDCDLCISIHKSPPILALEGGAYFIYGNLALCHAIA